ncbi:hypothetical protein AMAG_06185 [Allomyces macrogynus ATCC 38327]|uniref:DNA topoisomerase (ATP-hydrolyzing) n=1 Tax=Allomyces macrogynus (strain ATCC 38327) TaxID=578462 RepID=A0A0L0SFS9_ALLM3|nr:hypothetical protein AMAG_06185 [Allomyces macrogynus ATCC 38327]|eukprot:KNE61356.1 hypothetical protein AMAG_06185 [Allomyces macrogynus ATCC 38327]
MLPVPTNHDAPIDVLTAIEALVERMIRDAARGIPPSTAGAGHASPALTFRPLDQHEHNKSLAVFLRVADLVHANLAAPTPRVMTKRDVYYQDPALFGTQRVSDAAIELLASTLGVPRDALGVVAAPRGQAHGPCLARFTASMGSETSVVSFANGSHVPPGRRVTRLELDPAHVVAATGMRPAFAPGPAAPRAIPVAIALALRVPRFILIVEKDASFTALAHRGFAARHAGLLITASGFPDLATRQFLADLARVGAHSQHVPVYVVADADPHGLHIALTYMTGRRVDGSRCVVEVGDVNVGKVVHVAVHLRDVELERTVRMTRADRVRAVTLVRALHGMGLGEMQARQFRTSLQAMLHMNAKAEIQALDVDQLERYLETRLGLV